MTAHAPTDKPTPPRRRRRPLEVDPRLLLVSAVLVAVALTVTIQRTRGLGSISGAQSVTAAGLGLAAAWGLARWLGGSRPSRAATRGRVAVVFVLTLAFAGALTAFSTRDLGFGPVERGLVALAVAGLVVGLAEAAELPDPYARLGGVLVVAVLLAPFIDAGRSVDRSVITSAAGPAQLAAAQASGDTFRLRGRARSRYVAVTGYLYPGGVCSQVQIDEQQTTRIGLPGQDTGAGFSVCWNKAGKLYSLAAEQGSSRGWTFASISPVMLRSGTVFDADPVSNGYSDPQDAPRYGDHAGDVQQVDHTDPDASDFPLLDGEGRVYDDGSSIDDAVQAQVSKDGRRVRVVAAFEVHDRLRSAAMPRMGTPNAAGLEGVVQPDQRWLERLQPAGRELVVAIASLTPEGADARLVRFTSGGQQPWSESTTTNR